MKLCCIKLWSNSWILLIKTGKYNYLNTKPAFFFFSGNIWIYHYKLLWLNSFIHLKNSVTVSHNAQHQHPETEAASCNPTHCSFYFYYLHLYFSYHDPQHSVVIMWLILHTAPCYFIQSCITFAFYLTAMMWIDRRRNTDKENIDNMRFSKDVLNVY